MSRKLPGRQDKNDMASNLKYIFFGTPEFAAIILHKFLDAGMPPAAVVCNPDRPTGRKKIITPPPVKSWVMKYEEGSRNEIKILQPEKLDNEFLTSYSPLLAPCDFAVVAAYAKIIPQSVIDLFPRGILGIHPSLLPKYRGPTPIQSAILNGDEKTGVTIYLLDENIDHGPVVSSVKCQASSSDTYETLMRKLAELGGDLLTETLPKFLNGEIKPQPQIEAEATYTKKFTAEDGFIDGNFLEEAESGVNAEAAKFIKRKIMALNPEPGTWTIKNGKRVKLLAAEIQNNCLKLKKIQAEGRKPQTL